MKVKVKVKVVDLLYRTGCPSLLLSEIGQTVNAVGGSLHLLNTAVCYVPIARYSTHSLLGGEKQCVVKCPAQKHNTAEGRREPTTC